MLKTFLITSLATSNYQTLLTRWHQLHQLLVQLIPNSFTLAGLATYHCCVSEVFAQTQDFLRTRELFGQLAEASEQLMAGSWTDPQLDQACALIWLHARPVIIGLTKPPIDDQVVQLDFGLAARARALVGRPHAASRHHFLHSLRYLSLRASVSSVHHDLQALLLSHTQQTVLRRTVEAWSLELTDGLASELLLLLYLGGVETDIRRYVSE